MSLVFPDVKRFKVASAAGPIATAALRAFGGTRRPVRSLSVDSRRSGSSIANDSRSLGRRETLGMRQAWKVYDTLFSGFSGILLS